APVRADRRRRRERDREGGRPSGEAPADDPGARVGCAAGGGDVSATFVAARSVEEAVEALAAGARPVAGGTDLVVGARQGKAPLPGSIVAIHRLAELRGVELDGEALRMG